MHGSSALALEALAAAEISCSKSEREQWAKVLNMFTCGYETQCEGVDEAILYGAVKAETEADAAAKKEGEEQAEGRG